MVAKHFWCTIQGEPGASDTPSPPTLLPRSEGEGLSNHILRLEHPDAARGNADPVAGAQVQRRIAGEPDIDVKARAGFLVAPLDSRRRAGRVHVQHARPGAGVAVRGRVDFQLVRPDINSDRPRLLMRVVRVIDFQTA